MEKKTYKVLKGYTFFFGDGRDAKTFVAGTEFQATEEEVATQSWKVELVSGKKEMKEAGSDEGKPTGDSKGMDKPPKDKMQKHSVTK